MVEREQLELKISMPLRLPHKRAFDKRNDPMFLRNGFLGDAQWGFPLVRKQPIDLNDLALIACTNCIENDREYYECGVHFFVDDYEFEDIYRFPDKTYLRYRQYKFCCTPDFSVYPEMGRWRQIESIAHGRWCGAWWQSKGMNVVATISWDKYPSFDYCFDGVEEGSIVAVATYACRKGHAEFIRGYDAMLEKIKPEAVICYGQPFQDMRGNVYSVPVCHPRQFHREFKASPT